MAVSKSFNLGLILGQDNKISTQALSEDIPLGTEDYSTATQLPSTGNQVGDQAYVAETNRLYVWTGAGWYNIALINETPTWDSNGQPQAAYELDSNSGTPIVIQLAASDPEGLPIQWTYEAADSAADLFTISQNDDEFTITAKTLEDILSAGYDSAGGTAAVTFRASDGINIIGAVSEFTITFSNGVAVNLDTQGDAWANSTRVLLDAYSDGGTWTDSYDANTGTWTLTSTTKTFDGMYVQPRTMELGDEYLAVYYFSGYATDFNNRGGGGMYLYNVSNQIVEGVSRLSNDTDSLGFGFTGIDTTYNAYQGSICTNWWFAVRVINGVSRWWYRQSSHTSDNWVKIGDGTVSGVTYIGASCNRRSGTTPSVRMMDANDYIDTLTMD